MKEIIDKLKELHIKINEKCDNNCTKCPLNKLVFQSYSECRLDICDSLNEIYKMDFDIES